MEALSPAPSSRKLEPEPGQVVADRYRVLRLIGRGGMGSVWAAHHMVTRREVALKFLSHPGETDESRLRFLREARAACAVRHPNVVEVFDFIESPGHLPTIVLELLEGESLATLLARVERLSVEQTAAVISPVVSAVGSAHAKGIIHRDLKPDNIFLQRELDGSTVVKVLDFGVAKLAVVDDDARTGAGLTRTGALLGTPAYMSPEQVFGETDLDHRADIWAIGIILYQCLTGVLPTDAANVGQVFKIIVAGRIKPVRELAHDLPDDLAQLIDSMLSRKRDARPSDLREVAAVLDHHSQQAVPAFGPPRTAARSSTPSQPSIGPDEDGYGTLAEGEEPSRSEAAVEAGSAQGPRTAGGSSRRLVIAAAAMLATGLAVGGALIASARATPTAPEARDNASEDRRAAPTPPGSSATLPPPQSPPPTAALSALPAPGPSSDPGPATAALPNRKRSAIGASGSTSPRSASTATAHPSAAVHPEDPYGF